MKFFRSEKGFTGIDIAVSVIIIFLFVSLISMLIYHFNSTAREVELRAEATYLAINEIETIKNEGFSAYEERSVTAGNSIICEQEEIAQKEGFFKTITIMDYTDIEGNEDKIPNLVKKATVKISYMFKTKEQSVELSTILSKEN